MRENQTQSKRSRGNRIWLLAVGLSVLYSVLAFRMEALTEVSGYASSHPAAADFLLPKEKIPE